MKAHCRRSRTAFHAALSARPSIRLWVALQSSWEVLC
jgi:hypothetical protein